MCRGQGMNVMVMDVEGTDGRERGEDQVCIKKYNLSGSPVIILTSRTSNANRHYFRWRHLKFF